MRPPSTLAAALLEFLASVATEEPERVWSELEGCPLLPYFVTPQPVAGKSNAVFLKEVCNICISSFIT